MRKSHLVLGISLLSLTPLVACNRADTDETARRAASEAREIAGRAGEQLADSWLATKVQAQFFADDDVKARDISVSARDGVVTLAGTVDSLEAHEDLYFEAGDHEHLVHMTTGQFMALVGPAQKVHFGVTTHRQGDPTHPRARGSAPR